MKSTQLIMELLTQTILQEVEDARQKAYITELENKIEDLENRAGAISLSVVGYLHSDELETSMKFGGSTNLWMMKHDCDLEIRGILYKCADGTPLVSPRNPHAQI